MERVAFLIEHTGQRVECLLNPDSVTVTRQAGVRARRSMGGAVTGRTVTDDSLLATGGGVTQLRLELLFDTSKVGGPKPVHDVRLLTAPLWNLAENSADDEGQGTPPLVRFVWGKGWNVPGMVSAVAERFECFNAAGMAQRSWVSLRFVRVNVPPLLAATPDIPIDQLANAASALDPEDEQLLVHRVAGEADARDEGHSSERAEQLAHRYYGNPAYWRMVATFNNLDDPARLDTGMVLKMPPLRGLP
jgi:hypothetical protein